MHTNASSSHGEVAVGEQADNNNHANEDFESRAEHHYHDHLMNQPQQQQQQQQYHHYPQYQPLDAEASELCSNVHSSIRRAVDASHQIPTSQHVYYSTCPSYNNLMVEQRMILNNMMNCLVQTNGNNNEEHYYVVRDTFQQHQYHHQDQPLNNLNHQFQPSINTMYSSINNNSNFDCETNEKLMNSYDYVQDNVELMLDSIGQNIDDAAGLTSRDAQNVKATLDAAKRGRLYTTPTNIGTMINHNSSTFNKNYSNSNNYNQLSNNNHQQQLQRNRQRQLQYNSQYGGRRFTQLENKNIARPQCQFQDKIDNTYGPFKPIIKDKPNALVPLKLVLERDDQGNEFYSHPYEYELKNFQLDLDELTHIESSDPSNLDSTPIIWVETVEQLENMCKHIENEKEFAVDVEHHSYRSFQGITCLLQISTRTQDFVIDTIKLRSELHRLNRSFTNPSIVKVFHGADCDVLWLQRDFGVYVVKLFDTSRAAKLMKFAHLSLAFLMQHYCNLEPDKSYQLADWRERPIPLPMLQYARADAHYLLYIYDRLRHDLLTKSKTRSIGVELIKNVYERGREICSKRYEKPPFSETSHLSVLRKSRSTFNAKQMYAFKKLYAWRDSMSRELDESLGYVLPNNLMIRIAEYLPREPQGITALCNPMRPTVKKYLSDIHGIILKALSIPLDDLSKAQSGVSVSPVIKSLDLDTINHKQDIAHSAGFHEGSVGPNLLDKMNLLNCSNDEEQNSKGTKSEQTSSDETKKSEKKDSVESKDRRFEQSKNQPSRLYNII